MEPKPRLSVHKFGGSCLEGREVHLKTLGIIKQHLDRPVVVVLSAFKGVTDKLIKMMETAIEDLALAKNELAALRDFHHAQVREMVPEGDMNGRAREFLVRHFDILEHVLQDIFNGGLSDGTRDHVLSFGERLSASIFTCFLQGRGIDARFYSGESLITTTAEYGNAMPIMEFTSAKINEKLVPWLEPGRVAIITGFYAENEQNKITTMGRGGSDFTATIVANVLSKKYDLEVVFWKDVDGLLSANPAIEPNAKLIEHISYEEAKELAYFGSKVLHPICLRMVMADEGIPVQIRNFNKPVSVPYTRISKARITSDEIVKSIACIEHCAMITLQGAAMVSLPGIAAKLFSIMAKNKINVIFISQASSENNITFVVTKNEGKPAVDALKSSTFFGKSWFDILIEEVSLVAVVGHGMPYHSGVAGAVFTSLGNAGVNVRAIAQGSSELNISILIKPSQIVAAIHAIHQKFIK